MKYPLVEIHLDRLRENAEYIVKLAQKYGVQIWGVTKVTCGHPDVARTLLDAGIKAISDSRIENIQRMRKAGVDTYYTLIRIPMISEAETVVQCANCSLNSELDVLKALNEAAGKYNTVHDVILMVDLGDLREGIWPSDLMDIVGETLKLNNLRLKGLGTNLTCWGGVLPTEENLGQLVELAKSVEDQYQIQLEIISGGNSSSLPLLREGKMPHGINQLRIGEVIMLGNDTVSHKPFPNTRQDTFILKAEIIELKEKPSHPIGKIGLDAFGKPPFFEDKGIRLRAILGIGKQDVAADGLKPLDPGIEVVGGSSDHIILDLTEAEGSYKVGDIVDFTVGYECLLKAMTSPYVEKVVV
ncbi:ornithine racemase Orr [Anoxybacter fermentans]|uniref:ornithine racemase Orr n=1 Tax=Anoxybacter fermentans TaxID=1323375 RepID=UPI00196A2EB3|nr:ornithine racemase Orr [Anoxybacter fermentans]